MRVSSASVRSPTPEPASSRMSLSTRNEVVRRWRPPIPPEQPSTRRRIAALLLVEAGDPVPVRGQLGEALLEAPVELVVGAHLQQVREVCPRLLPLMGAACGEGLVPKPELGARIAADLSFQPEGLVHHQRFIPALDPDAI